MQRFLRTRHTPTLGLLCLALVPSMTGEAAAQAFDTNLVGSQVKAKQFDVTCDAGSVLIGVHYGAGKDLNYMQPLCRPLANDKLGGTVKGMQTWGDQTSDDSRVDNTLACPAQTVVQRLHGYLSRRGEIHAFALGCMAVDPASGQEFETRQSATKGGQAVSSGDADCGANAMAIGMNIAVGGVIERLGLSCLPIVFPPLEPAKPVPLPADPPKKPPHPVDNADPPHPVDNGG